MLNTQTHNHRSWFSVTHRCNYGSVSPTCSPRQWNQGPVWDRGMVSGWAGKPQDVRCAHTDAGSLSIVLLMSSSVVLSSNPMLDVNNFTIFIKNSIRFPLFNLTRWVHQPAQRKPVTHNLIVGLFLIISPNVSVSEGIFPPPWQLSRLRAATTIQRRTLSAPYSVWETCWTILDRRSLTWRTRSDPHFHHSHSDQA